MANSQAAKHFALQRGIGSWWSDRGNLVDQSYRAAMARGHELWVAGIRDGLPIAAKKTAELQALGAKAIQAGSNAVHANVAAAKAVVGVVKDPHSPESQRLVREAKNQAMAAVHGGGDALTLGLADRGSSAVRALVQSHGDLKTIGEHYGANMDQERAQDEYEGAHYGTARAVGSILGTAASALVPVGEIAQGIRLARFAPALAGRAATIASRVLEAPVLARIPQATRIIPREQAALAVLGGGSGVATQAVSDLASEHQGSLGDYAAAAVAGAAQGVAGHRLGAVRTGALGGATTSTLQDMFNDRPVSFERAATASLTGGIGAKVAGKYASDWSDGLPSFKNQGRLSKGELGERMSIARSYVRGEPPVDFSEAAIQLAGDRTTKQDHAITAGPVEAKFGRTAKLMRGQRKVAADGRYARVDHFHPEDIGTIAAVPTSQLTSQIGGILSNRWDDTDAPDWGSSSLLPRPDRYVLRPAR